MPGHACACVCPRVHLSGPSSKRSLHSKRGLGCRPSSKALQADTPALSDAEMFPLRSLVSGSCPQNILSGQVISVTPWGQTEGLLSKLLRVQSGGQPESEGPIDTHSAWADIPRKTLSHAHALSKGSRLGSIRTAPAGSSSPLSKMRAPRHEHPHARAPGTAVAVPLVRQSQPDRLCPKE